MRAPRMRPSVFDAPAKGRIIYGCFALFVLVITVFLALMDVISTPWAYYLGGRSFHILPVWRGWGRMHSNISGDYALYIRLGPDEDDSSGQSDLVGDASICTPRGEIIDLRIHGTMRPHLNRFTDGEAITLEMSHRKPVLTTVFAGDLGFDSRPSLSFGGRWQNPNLVLTDTGSLSDAFQPDGTVYRGSNPKRRPHEIVPLTLKPGSYADFKGSCPAPRPDSR